MKTIASDSLYLVVGLGTTGLSCVRHLAARGKQVAVTDSREQPPTYQALLAEFPQVPFYAGFREEVFAAAATLVVSPGVPLSTPEIQQAIQQGKAVTSDVELFLAEHRGKVVAITGTNAKSTVTDWLGEALKRAGRSVVVAGNIGTPVLATLDTAYEIAVLELSSFQLELIRRLSADVAVVLNISEDHLDRYASMAHYVQAKQRIYFGCRHALFNRDEPLTQPLLPAAVPQTSFGLSAPDLAAYGMRESAGQTCLAQGFTELLACQEISLLGRHNALNALVVLALADALENPREATFAALRDYSGLAHRCQKLATLAGVTYVNDSKATNVSATMAALVGLAVVGPPSIHLLLGGQAKGQDLSPLVPCVERHCRTVLVYGQDQAEFLALIARAEPCVDLKDAFNRARSVARAGETILLSPACASFDQFADYQKRGEAFAALVEDCA